MKFVHKFHCQPGGLNEICALDVYACEKSSKQFRKFKLKYFLLISSSNLSKIKMHECRLYQSFYDHYTTLFLESVQVQNIEVWLCLVRTVEPMQPSDNPAWMASRPSLSEPSTDPALVTGE